VCGADAVALGIQRGGIGNGGGHVRSSQSESVCAFLSGDVHVRTDQQTCREIRRGLKRYITRELDRALTTTTMIN
jgi:hypothetical protein